MMPSGSSMSRFSLAFSRFQVASRGTSSSVMPDTKSRGTVDPDWENAKSYELIPGPKQLLVLGNVLRYLPFFGEYWKQSRAEVVTQLREKYGNIVKLRGVPGMPTTVLLFDPNDFEKMYRNEGQWPGRVAMETAKLYHERRSDFYQGCKFLSASDGKQWHDRRSKLNPHLMHPRAIRPHVGQINDVASDFVDKIRNIRDPESLELPASFNNEINKWALESICAIGFDHRMGCLEPNLAPDSEPQLFIDSIHVMFDLMYKLEMEPSLWKFYDTPDLKNYFQVMDNTTSITHKYVNLAKKRLANKPIGDIGDASVIEKLISVDERTATITLIEMIGAGVDTTANSAAVAIYQIALNSEVQEKLRKEAYEVLPSKTSPVTVDTLDNIPYLKAVIKESMRLMPLFPGNARRTTSDIVIRGYRIPKSVNVIMHHAVAGYDSQSFPDPEKFIPERWLKESSDTIYSAKNAHPFAYMPFGFGPRTCIGRRFAQLEMETLLIKLVRNFRLEWHHGPVEMEHKFVTKIISPLRVRMIDNE